MKLSCPESARPGLPDSPFPQLRYAPRPPAQKPMASRRRLSENQRGPLEREEETEGATPSRFALAICPPFSTSPSVSLAGNHAQRRSNHLDPTRESARGSLSDPSPQPVGRVVRSGSLQAPLFPSIPSNSCGHAPTGGSLARHVAARSSGSSRRRLSDLMSFRV
jgi:hypothetical protein